MPLTNGSRFGGDESRERKTWEIGQRLKQGDENLGN
jgi:hypothetical protein